jgi:transmembrane protein 18
VLLVFFSEYLNEFAAQNAHKFSHQQYFDSNGIFISIIFCSPILINCIFILARWLMLSFDLMTNLKKAQLKQEARRRKEQSQLVASQNHEKNE